MGSFVIRRKPKRYRKVKLDYVAENILARKFTAEKPNQKWCTDVTEFKYGNGKKAYLSAIIDLYDKSILRDLLGHSNITTTSLYVNMSNSEKIDGS